MVNQPASETLFLNPTTDDLALRAAPSLDAALLRRLPLNTSLKALEARQVILARLGVEGQWVHVQTPEGDQGYVAAWYLRVAEAIGPSFGLPEGLAAPENEAVTTVKVATDQLALRTAPVIDEANLIIRLPLGALLTVLEPEAGSKLGVEGQWLKVKDTAGHEGYVAAWYLSLCSQL